MPKSSFELGRILARAVEDNIRKSEFPAIAGKVRGDGSVTLRGSASAGDLLPANKIYVRLYGNNEDVREAWAVNIGRKAGVPLICKYSYQGYLVAVRADDPGATLFLGEQAGAAAIPPIDGEAMPLLRVSGRNLKPGRVEVWISGTLKVNAYAFPYTDSAGNRKVWSPTGNSGNDGNCLNIASYVPAASGGYDTHCWVQIALDPDATSPALIAVAGTEQYTTISLSATGYTDIVLPDGALPLDAVILKTGDNDESDIPEADWAYARIPSGTGGGDGFDSNDIMVDADLSIMIDADYNVMVQS